MAFLGPIGVDLAVRYGFEIVAVPSFVGSPATRARVAEVEVRAEYGAFNLEAIAAAVPDVMICDKFAVEAGGLDLDAAQRIAPVAALDFVSDLEWKDNLRFVADALGVLDRFEDDLGRLEARAAALGGSLASPPPTVAIVSVGTDSLTNYTEIGFAAAIVAEVGLQPIDLAEELSLERIPEVDADLVFAFVAEGDEGDGDLAELLETNPLWRNLPAVQAGRARVVGGHLFGFGLLEADLVLADLEQALR